MALHEAPKVLLEAFKLALETNRMDAFFEQALKSENGNNSLEARYRRIADWMVQEFEREDYLHVPKDDAYI